MTQAAATTTQKATPAYSRKTLKAIGRKKRALKLRSDKEFAKTYFDAKSKRAIDKKSTFRKKKKSKK